MYTSTTIILMNSNYILKLLLSVYLPSCSSRMQTNQQKCIAFKCNYSSHYNVNNLVVGFFTFLFLFFYFHGVLLEDE